MSNCYRCKKEDPACRVWNPINIMWCLPCFDEQKKEGQLAIKELPKSIKELPLEILGPLHSMEIEVEWDRIDITSRHIH